MDCRSYFESLLESKDQRSESGLWVGAMPALAPFEFPRSDMAVVVLKIG